MNPSSPFRAGGNGSKRTWGQGEGGTWGVKYEVRSTKLLEVLSSSGNRASPLAPGETDRKGLGDVEKEGLGE